MGFHGTPLWLASEPGTVQNWLFSCWHCCMHSACSNVIQDLVEWNQVRKHG